MTYIGGKPFELSGTSAAAPAIAGFFSNINAARIALGKSTVGWVNPALYLHSSEFINDVTSGNNKCTASKVCCRQGYYATTGWDPASGLGTPNYGKLHQILVSMGSEINSALFPPTYKPSTRPTQKPTGPSFRPTPLPTRTPTISLSPTVFVSSRPKRVNSNYPTQMNVAVEDYIPVTQGTPHFISVY